MDREVKLGIACLITVSKSADTKLYFYQYNREDPRVDHSGLYFRWKQVNLPWISQDVFVEACASKNGV